MTPDATTDIVLVAAAQRGERDALERLLRNHFDRIHAVCRRITAHDSDADDATQHALLAIVKGIVRFDGTSSFSTWSFRVATNAALDEVRRRGRRPVPHDLQDETAVPASVRLGAGSGTDGTDSVALRVDIDRAMRQLPPEFRAAVTLRDLCGLDYAEIGDILGIPPGTVRSRIARGRAALHPLMIPSDTDTDTDTARADARTEQGNRSLSTDRQRTRDV